MAVPLIRSSSTSSSIQQGLSINKPTGTASGDILVIGVCGVNNNVNFAPPSGFIQVGPVLVQSSNKRLMVAYKVAGGSEPASYSPNVSVGDSSDFDTGTSAILIAVSGAKNAINIANSGSATNTVPIVVNTGVNNLVLSFVGDNGSPSSSATVPATWTSVADVVSDIAMAEDARTQLASKTFAATGSIFINMWSASRVNLMTITLEESPSLPVSITQYPILLF